MFSFAPNPIIVIGLLLSTSTYVLDNAVLMCHKRGAFTHHDFSVLIFPVALNGWLHFCVESINIGLRGIGLPLRTLTYGLDNSVLMCHKRGAFTHHVFSVIFPVALNGWLHFCAAFFMMPFFLYYMPNQCMLCPIFLPLFFPFFAFSPLWEP